MARLKGSYTLKEIKEIWNANKNKANFWISLISVLIIASLVVGKIVFKLDISTADITMIVSGIGALIVLIGNSVNNSIIVQTGESLDSTKIAKTADGISDTVEQLQTELSKVKAKVSDVQQAVAPETLETAKPVVRTLGETIDKDGNVITSKDTVGTDKK